MFRVSTFSECEFFPTKACEPRLSTPCHERPSCGTPQPFTSTLFLRRAKSKPHVLSDVSACRVSAVCKYRLPCDPPTVSNKKANKRDDVLDLCEATKCRRRLVISDSVFGFLAVKEWGIHRSGANSRNRYASVSKLLGRSTSKVFHGCFHSAVC